MTKFECYEWFRKQFPNWLMTIETNNFTSLEYNNRYSMYSDISFFELIRLRQFFNLSSEDDLIIYNSIVQDTDDNDYLCFKNKDTS